MTPEVYRQGESCRRAPLDNLAASSGIGDETHGFADRPRDRGALVEGEDGTVLLQLSCVNRTGQMQLECRGQGSAEQISERYTRPKGGSAPTPPMQSSHLWSARHRTGLTDGR